MNGLGMSETKVHGWIVSMYQQSTYLRFMFVAASIKGKEPEKMKNPN
jgi:hypothetical protein